MRRLLPLGQSSAGAVFRQVGHPGQVFVQIFDYTNSLPTTTDIPRHHTAWQAPLFKIFFDQ
jgi:hypothetical protein